MQTDLNAREKGIRHTVTSQVRIFQLPEIDEIPTPRDYVAESLNLYNNVVPLFPLRGTDMGILIA